MFSYNGFLNWATKHRWRIKPADRKAAVPSEISARYKNIPAEWLDFACSLESCSNSAENVWFLTADNYLPKDENEWRYNEFELISLEAAQDDEALQSEITEFWNNHLPIVMSVANGYEYYAIDTSDGSIVHGFEPEFEEIETVAASFSEFLEKIIDDEIVLYFFDKPEEHMSKISDYINKLSEMYGDEVTAVKSNYTQEQLLSAPEALREFYAEYSEVELPFGHIYPIDNSIKESQAEPFKSEGWFSFGEDEYFTFWLCLYKPDKDGLSITLWDHELGHEIGEAMYDNVVELLEAVRLEYEESKQDFE